MLALNSEFSVTEDLDCQRVLLHVLNPGLYRWLFLFDIISKCKDMALPQVTAGSLDFLRGDQYNGTSSELSNGL